MAKLLLKTSLISLDEAPMAKKFYFKTLNKTIRDILYSRSSIAFEKPIDGMTIDLGDDFRQILVIILEGHCYNIVDALITSLYLDAF